MRQINAREKKCELKKAERKKIVKREKSEFVEMKSGKKKALELILLLKMEVFETRNLFVV